MVGLSRLKHIRLNFCRGEYNKTRRSEKMVRDAAGKMDTPHRQRIDRLREASGMKREHFDATVMDLVSRQKVDLVQGELSERLALTESEFQDMIEIDGVIYLYLIWLDRIPAPPARIATHPPNRWKNRNIPLSSEMAQWLHAMERAERILKKIGSDG